MATVISLTCTTVGIFSSALRALCTTERVLGGTLFEGQALCPGTPVLCFDVPPTLPLCLPICPWQIGLLATVGVADAPIIPRPRVGVMSTGDELVEPGEKISGGFIRDSNR